MSRTATRRLSSRPGWPASGRWRRWSWPTAATIALLPRVDVPVGDDWVYARTVERFIHGDGFRILDATVATLVLQALWGAAVTSVLGFSYVTLRLSTVALAAVGRGRPSTGCAGRSGPAASGRRWPPPPGCSTPWPTSCPTAS